jgi:murein DD-endopeptidase MepM/ murein hydrolase activator NlpD
MNATRPFPPTHGSGHEVKSQGGRADDTTMAVPSRSRGRFVVAAAFFVGVVGASSFVDAQAVGAPVALDLPGSALVQAERLALRRPPVPEGKILFPLDPGTDCYILDNYGDGRGTRLHEGVDILGSSGRSVYAVATGKLTKRYTNTGTAGWGWALFDAATGTTYKYYHLTDDPNGLIEGATVNIGDVIGFVGSSGTSSPDNIHLHFEVRPGNVPVDPLPLLFVDTKICKVSPPIR